MQYIDQQSLQSKVTDHLEQNFIINETHYCIFCLVMNILQIKVKPKFLGIIFLTELRMMLREILLQFKASVRCYLLKLFLSMDQVIILFMLVYSNNCTMLALIKYQIFPLMKVTILLIMRMYMKDISIIEKSLVALQRT